MQRILLLLTMTASELVRAAPPSRRTAAAFWQSSFPGQSSSSSSKKEDDDPTTTAKTKAVTFLRHGCTYMNEYLRGADGGKRFGSPQFTDVFASAEQRSKYHDTPLSPLGLKQVRGLKQQRCLAFVQDCDLVVVSPLTRALQTFDMGLKGHFEQHESSRNVPVVALPEAAERLYLVSDLGRPVADLQPEFSYVDFETGFLNHDAKSWWYQREHSSEGTAEEWRPVGNGQRYGCASEPSVDFNFRMTRLHTWLHDRPEKHIAVVCHHGVINWMLAMDFDNCQYHTVPFDSVQPRALIRDNNEQTTAR